MVLYTIVSNICRYRDPLLTQSSVRFICYQGQSQDMKKLELNTICFCTVLVDSLRKPFRWYYFLSSFLSLFIDVRISYSLLHFTLSQESACLRLISSVEYCIIE